MKVSELLKMLTACPQTSEVYAVPSDDISDSVFEIENVLIDLSGRLSDKGKPVSKNVLIVFEN